MAAVTVNPINLGNSGAGSGGESLPNGSIIISTCSVCYDPTDPTTNNCGSDADLNLLATLNEKLSWNDSGYQIFATPLFPPVASSVVSDTITQQALLPYGLPPITGNAAAFKWGDLVQSPSGVTITTWTATKYQKIGNKLIIELKAPSVMDLNAMVGYIQSIPSQEFVSLYLAGNKDFHLYRQFIETFDNPTTLVLRIEYNLSQNISNFAHLFWQIYNVVKSNSLTIYNQNLPKPITIRTKLLPIEKIDFTRTIVFNNQCPTLVIKRRIEAAGVIFQVPIPQVYFQTYPI